MGKFGVRIMPSGHRSFIVQYRRGSKTRRYRIGSCSEYPVEAARSRARDILQGVREGKDPSAERKAERHALPEPTIKDLGERFLRDYAEPRSKPRYLLQQRRMFNARIVPAIGNMAVQSVTSADVIALHNRLRTTPYEANRVAALLSIMFKQAEVWRWRPEGSNPVRLVTRYRERRRERLLTDAEVAAIFHALDTGENTQVEPAAALLAVRLLFATACRASEILGLQWSFLQNDTAEIVWPDSKANCEMRKPLTAEVRRLLANAQRIVGNPYVCTNSDRRGALSMSVLQKSWGRILKAATVPHCGLHAIRHRAATDIANNPDIPIHIGMKLTGHKTVTTFLRYHHAQREQAREAAEKVSRQRMELIGTKPEVVVLDSQGVSTTPSRRA